MKILFASSEVYPLVKTGGLADVAQALPQALQQLKQDIRIICPAYRSLKNLVNQSRLIGTHSFLEGDVNVYETTLPDSEVIVWLVECPSMFDREGGPYLDNNDVPWPDNAQRFALFSRVIVAIALDEMRFNWVPDILHCNDWQTALAPALLHFSTTRPQIVFTIHNLAYQGVFPMSVHQTLELPEELAHYESMEFHNQFSFIKGGIVYADQVTTVSPTYANEIQTEKYGAGLDALLRYHSKKLTGIINGIDEAVWNPLTDTYIDQNYDSQSLHLKVKNKSALQEECDLKLDVEAPLFASITRLVSQKGIDLILDVMENLMSEGAQVIILGKGDEEYEAALLKLKNMHPRNIHVHIGYDEVLAHKITASADFFMMPSRFEPCGLNQMYSQSYGTLPIVHRTGGLADTVIDQKNHDALNTGIIFEDDNSDSFLQAIYRSLDIFNNSHNRLQLQKNAMKKNFSWKRSALEYINLYTDLIS